LSFTRKGTIVEREDRGGGETRQVVAKGASDFSSRRGTKVSGKSWGNGIDGGLLRPQDPGRRAKNSEGTSGGGGVKTWTASGTGREKST